MVRASRIAHARALVAALRQRGVGLIEFTLTTDGALDAIADTAAMADVVVGAGTVLDAGRARAAAEAGAKFLVSPCIEAEVATVADAAGIPYIPGAFSPNEIQRALALRPYAIKVFPASLGGPSYLRQLFGPFPALRAIPSGGIGVEEVGAYIGAGAFAVSLGSNLVPKSAVEDGAYVTIPSLEWTPPSLASQRSAGDV